MSTAASQRKQRWMQQLQQRREQVSSAPPLIVEGRINRMVGLTLETEGVQARIGTRCRIEGTAGVSSEAEVVGFSGDRLFLMPTHDIEGIGPESHVIPTGRVYEAPVGFNLLGRVIDGSGEPLDDKGPLNATGRMPLSGRAINPMRRQPISEPLDVGIRTINALLTVGRGQRMGLFAGSGVGKSVLMGMMTRFTTADVVVVGLIGERGREVKEFIEQILGSEGMSRSVVVAAPADQPPVVRIHAAATATSIAEYFRDQGKSVLLLMDSLTRYAQAYREVGLSIGEPPATKGYPASVFARLPQLVERAGNSELGGSITAFYTVLTEGDDPNDPIADAARAILDGHIVLSRTLSDSGHYPAIDIEASISRLMTQITTDAQQEAARWMKRLYSSYEKNRDLINVGAYSPGSDRQVDEAIRTYPYIAQFLQQGMGVRVSLADSLHDLGSVIETSEVQLPQNDTVKGFK